MSNSTQDNIVDLSFPKWEGFIKKMAFKFVRWVYAWGHKIDYEDAYSEMTLRWVLAVKGFKPELGFSFATYFVTAIRNSVRPYVMSLREQRESDMAIHLDADVADNGESASIYHDVIKDTSYRGVDANLIKEEIKSNIQNKTPLLHRMLELMEEQPDELMKELEAAKAQRAYAEYLQLHCYDAAAPNSLTPKVLSKVFGFNWKQRLRLKQETEEALSYVE